MKNHTSFIFVFIMGILTACIGHSIFSPSGFFIESPKIRDGFSDDTVSPNEFARNFYGLMFALNTYDSQEYNEKLITLYFTPETVESYKAVAAQDRVLAGEVGCLNGFNIFMDTQEVPHGFYAGKHQDVGSHIHIPVTFYYREPDQHHNAIMNTVTLDLIPHDKSWKIYDILYSGEKGTLRSHMAQCRQH